MQVETFECVETASEPLEASEEAKSIIDALGLEGQQTLLVQTDENNVTRCPYRHMRKDEQFVYGVLCPKKTRLNSYDASPIPLRVLQIAAHANSLDLFTGLYVWHQDETQEKDPVLIATARHPVNTWMTVTYILARWGEELESWPTLINRAMEKKRNQITDAYKAIQAKLRNACAAEEMTSEELIEKGSDYLPEIRV